MSKNDKKYFYKTLAMSNDINLGETGKGVKEKSKEVCQLYFIYERL
jgi:hypothetical protein